MGWKDWPYWLKGGIIGGILTIVVILLSRVGGNYFISLFYLPYLFMGAPIAFIKSLVGGSGELPNIYLLLVCYLFVGALIGWIVGKIKNRNLE